MKNKSQIDWLRACNNLPPRPMDLKDKIVISSCCVAIVILFAILAWG